MNKTNWLIAVTAVFVAYVASDIIFNGHSDDPPKFFGATVVSGYYSWFDGKIVCAKVRGWHEEKEQCMCMLTERDPRFGGDRTLLSYSDACQKQAKMESVDVHH